MKRVVGRGGLCDEAVRREDDDAPARGPLEGGDERERRLAREVLDHVERDDGIEAPRAENTVERRGVRLHEGPVKAAATRVAQRRCGDVDADREAAKPGRREGRGAAAADVEERATAREGAPERAPEEDRAQRGEARHWKSG